MLIKTQLLYIDSLKTGCYLGKMISKEEVLKVAKLAKLSLTEAELEKYSKDLGQILNLVEKLNTLDLKNIEPTSHAHNEGYFSREDSPIDSGVIEKALEVSPERDGPFFQVPKVIG